MTVNPRRPGFRLPWTDEGDGSTDSAQAAQATAEPVTAEAAGDDVTRAERSQPETPEADATSTETVAGIAEPAPEAAAEPQAAEPATASGYAEPAPADDNAPPSDGADFLSSLVSAMRGVAEEARDTSIAELRTSVEQRVEELRSAAAERADDLRRRADLDQVAIEDWERSEVERIKSEAQHRAETRRQSLEQQLADHQAATDLETEATRQRLADHERELDAFFAQLASVTDPAAFVAAAKRIPEPPDLAAPAASAASTPMTLNRRLEALGIRKAPVGAPAAVEEASDEPEPEIDDGSAAETVDMATDAPTDTDTDTATDAPAEPAAPPQPTTTGVLAERLAQLDERLSGATATQTAPAADVAGAEASTAIVVKGLGSFGAITSFKQALERVEGIRGVTLSLGPTGEFVYRASHLAGFDLLAAIRSVEGQNVEIEQEDGALRVTVSRSR